MMDEDEDGAQGMGDGGGLLSLFSRGYGADEGQSMEPFPLGVYVIWLVMGPLSILGGLFIMLSILWKPKLRKHSGMHFVFCQALCDFIFTLNFLLDAILHNSLPDNQPSTLCTFQAFISQFFALGTTSWYMVISVRTLLLLTFPSIGLYKYTKLVLFHTYVWSVCTILAFIPLPIQQYGSANDAGCWLKNDSSVGELLRVLLFAVPMGLYFVFSLGILVAVLWRLQVLRREFRGHTILNKELRFKTQMIAYTVVSIVFWGPPVIMRIMELIGDVMEPHLLTESIINSFCFASQGLANSLIWMTSSSFLKNFRNRNPLSEVLLLLWRNKNKKKKRKSYPLINSVDNTEASGSIFLQRSYTTTNNNTTDSNNNNE